MMNHHPRQERASVRALLHRADRVAADLNVLLVVIALGLATLDFTFFVTQKFVDNLPPITHINYDAPDAPAK